jgi:hypothetical protein
MRSYHCSSLSKLRPPNRWPLSDRLWARTPLAAVKLFAVNSLRFVSPYSSVSSSSTQPSVSRYSFTTCNGCPPLVASRHYGRLKYSTTLASSCAITRFARRPTERVMRRGGSRPTWRSCRSFCCGRAVAPASAVRAALGRHTHAAPDPQSSTASLRRGSVRGIRD